MKKLITLIPLLLLTILFNACDDNTNDPNMGENCDDFDAILDYTINLTEDYSNSENTFHVAAFHNIPDSDPTNKTNAIQITWEISPSVHNGISLLVKDDVWEVGEYTYSSTTIGNSFIIINTTSVFGPTMPGNSFTIKITDIEKGSLKDLGTNMQQDYTYLKGSFNGQFTNAALDNFPISGTFEICND